MENRKLKKESAKRKENPEQNMLTHIRADRQTKYLAIFEVFKAIKHEKINWW